MQKGTLKIVILRTLKLRYMEYKAIFCPIFLKKTKINN